MKKKKWIWFLAVLLIMGFIQGEITVTKAAASTKVKADKTVYVLKKGKSGKIKVTVTPKGKKVRFTSSNPKVASVNAAGVVKAKKNGTTVITAKAGNSSAKCKVIVGTPVSGVFLDKSEIIVGVGNKETLTTTVMPQKASQKTVSFSSSDKSVATVSAEGVIKGISIGCCKITAKSTDGNNKKASVFVYVTAGSTSTDDDKNYVWVKGIAMDTDEMMVGIGSPSNVNAKVVPEDASTQEIEYMSDDTSIATVDSDGTVSGVSAGTCKITAKTKEFGYTAVRKIRVVSSEQIMEQMELLSEEINEEIEKIKSYYSLLVVSSASDVQKKITEIQDDLKKGMDEADVEKLNSTYKGAANYYKSICSEFGIYITGSDVSGYKIEEAQSNYLYVTPRNQDVKSYQVKAVSKAVITQTATPAGAVAAYLITIPNGHSRIIQIFKQCDLSEVPVVSLRSGITNITFSKGQEKFIKDNVIKYYPVIYAYLSPEKILALNTLTVRMENENVKLTYGKEEFTGLDSVTLTYADKSYTYLFVRGNLPELVDEDNTIYASEYKNGVITVYGKNASLGNDFSVNYYGSSHKCTEVIDGGDHEQVTAEVYLEKYIFKYYSVSTLFKLEEMTYYKYELVNGLQVKQDVSVKIDETKSRIDINPYTTDMNDVSKLTANPVLKLNSKRSDLYAIYSTAGGKDAEGNTYFAKVIIRSTSLPEYPGREYYVYFNNI